MPCADGGVCVGVGGGGGRHTPSMAHRRRRQRWDMPQEGPAPHRRVGAAEPHVCEGRSVRRQRHRAVQRGPFTATVHARRGPLRFCSIWKGNAPQSTPKVQNVCMNESLTLCTSTPFNRIGIVWPLRVGPPLGRPSLWPWMAIHSLHLITPLKMKLINVNNTARPHPMPKPVGIRLELNLKLSELVPNSKSCEFERIRFQWSHNESL